MSDETLLPAHQQMLVEHLPYELGMLEWCYATLHDDHLGHLKAHVLVRNLAIESFWLHDRNLLEFFNYPRNGSEQGVASASDFIKSPKLDAKINLQTLIDEINVQVAHLQYGRPSDALLKLNSARMSHVRGAIKKTVTLFEADMTDGAKDYWKPLQHLEIEITKQVVEACTVISSTATIGSISIVGPNVIISITEKSE